MPVIDGHFGFTGAYISESSSGVAVGGRTGLDCHRAGAYQMLLQRLFQLQA